MDFFEAMKLMKEGKKVKLKRWNVDSFIGLREEEVKIFGKTKTKYTVVNVLENELSSAVSFSALVSSEWDVIHED